MAISLAESSLTRKPKRKGVNNERELQDDLDKPRILLSNSRS
jgi:hypothetical protein